jgi:carboxylesterase type B
VWNSNITEFSIDVAGQSFSAGEYAQTTAEDCLSIAIWAPLNISADAKLPVALFIPGGSFIRGGITVPYQIPAGWVERSQKHIVVAANYRLGILGFPYAAALEDQNPGLLDQRMALKWVHANIPSFGGDRDRITLWGQSAGGVSVDMLTYAYPDEPLAAGVFMQSGTAMVNVTYPDKQYQNFTYVAKNLGCNFTGDALAELECMQAVPVVRLMNFVGEHMESGTGPKMRFPPMPDNRTVFFNYTERSEKGLVARIPALVSTTANEESSLFKYPLGNIEAGPNMTAVDKETVNLFVCLASNTTDARDRLGLTTYRYQYAGNFSNLTPLPWMGAYHASDTPLFMGSYENLAPATDFQKHVAEKMQDYLLAFITDPLDGLRDAGWMPYNSTDEGGGNMLRFASGEEVEMNTRAAEIDDACVKGAPYNHSP